MRDLVRSRPAFVPSLLGLVAFSCARAPRGSVTGARGLLALAMGGLVASALSTPAAAQTADEAPPSHATPPVTAPPAQSAASPPAPALLRGQRDARVATPDDEPKASVSQRAAGHVVLSGPDYEVHFTGTGVLLQTGGGPEPALFGYRFLRARAGGHVLFARGVDGDRAAAAEPRSGGADAVRYDHAPGFAEVWAGQPSGVEQLFEIAEPLPDGADLELRGAFETELHAERIRRWGVAFSTQEGPAGQPPRRVFSYGEPTIIDATGRAVPGALALEGNELVLRFRARDLAGLAYPIRVDPLLSTNFVISATSNDETLPAIAYDSSRDQYIVAFEVLVSTSPDNYDIRAWRVSSAGSRISSAFWIADDPDVNERRPSVAYSPVEDAWVVAHEYDDEVAMTALKWSGGEIYGTWQISSQPSGISSHPKVVHQGGDEFLIAWLHRSTGIPPHDYSILCEQVFSDASFVTYDSGSYWNDDWVVATSTLFQLGVVDAAYNATEESFYLVWSGTFGVYGAGLSKDLRQTVGPGASLLGWFASESAVTWNSARNEWQVAFTSDVPLGGSVTDVFLQSIHGSGPNAGLLRGGLRVIAASANDQLHPAIHYSNRADELLIAYAEDISAGDHDLYAQPVRSDGLRRGSPLAINDNSSHDTLHPAIGLSEDTGRFLVAFERQVTASWSIYAQQLTDTAPHVLGADPPNEATNVPTDGSVKVYFSDAMASATLTSASCRLVNVSTSSTVTSTVTYNSFEQSVLIVPLSALAADTAYRIEVTPDAEDTSENPLETAFEATFTTGAGPGLIDTDGDGLLDIEEALLGTDPNEIDTDGDGLPDIVEIFWSDPLRADTDGDGDTDGEEYIAQTDPNDPTDGSDPDHDVTPPTVVSVSPTGGASEVEVGARVYVTFSEPIDTATVDYGTSLLVEDISGPTLIAGAVAFQNQNRTIRFTPSSSLPTGATFFISVPDGSGMIADPAGNTLPGFFLSAFSTQSATAAPAIADQEPLHHPSFGEPTSAGQMGRHHGSGGVPATDIGSPSAFFSTPGIGKDCIGGCESGCGGPKMPPLTGNDGGILGSDKTAVLLHNGAFVHSRSDWAHPDRSLMSLAIRRTYRSNLNDPGTSDAFVGLYGERTVSNWETRILDYAGTGNPFTLLTPDGRFYEATWTGSGWEMPAGFFARVHLDSGAGEVKLIYQSGLTYAYATSSGRLLYVRDRNGNVQSLTYDGSTLTTITDATGREIELSYDSGLLTTITSYDGLEIVYGYDAYDRLETVTFPATDDFPYGRMESYGYTGEALMTTLTNGRGETYLVNHYDAYFGTVESQDHIHGTHYYLYEWDHSGGVRTTAVDRMGHVTEVIHNAIGQPITVTQYNHGANELDPTSEWTTTFAHSTTTGQIVKVVYPRGNVHTWAYDANGQVSEHRRKTADAADSDANDIVERWKHDPDFGVVLRYMEPRANIPGITAAERVALTRFYFYDHEPDMEARLNAESTEMGATVSIVGDAERTFGRPGTGKFPAQTGTTFDDDDGDGLPDRGGNLWIDKGPSPLVVNPANPSQFLGSRQAIETFYSYNAYGQPLIARDPMGDRSRWQYYSGAYHVSTNPNAGFLLYGIVDSGLTGADLDLSSGDPDSASEPNGHLALTTTFGYDLRGNLVSQRSPRGLGRTDDVFHTRMTYDANNLLRTRTVSHPFNYQSVLFYDGNMKLAEERTPKVLPVDTNGNGIQDGASEQSAGSPAYFTTLYTYCMCNDVESVTRDATGLALTTFYEYDMNQRRVLVRHPENHVDVTLYDERDLVRRTIRGANDTTQSSTTRFLYDENANLVAVYDDDLDVDTGDTPTVYTYDLFDRQTLVTDELGNESETVYDKGSFVRRTIARGPATHSGSPEILAQSFMEYDEAGRLFQADHDHFDAIGNASLAGGALTPPIDNSGSARGNLVSSVTVYDADGRTAVSIDARGNATAHTYDGAGRMVETEDARGNVTEVVHDADSQTIAVLEGETADVGSAAAFVSRTFYDELGRPIVRVSPLGNAVRSIYDSRGLVRQTADAQADTDGWASALDTYSEHPFGGSYPDVQISGAGNRTLHAYDGAGRLVGTERELTSDGTGDGTVIGTITTLREYDRSSRLVGQLDDNGNRTTYVYDAQSRRVVVRNADGTQKLYLYDRAGNLRYTKDERNVVVTRDVDELGRATATTVEQLAFGPGQVTYEAFQYDGLSRMLRGENNHAIVELRYDSLGPVIRETQTVNVGADRTSSGASWSSTVTAAVNAVYDANGNRTQLAYPGGATINETYDVIDRRKLVQDDATTIAEYMYAGRGYRVLEKRLPLAGTTLFRAYDGERRVTRHDQRRTSDDQRLAGYTYAWDRVGNRWYERTLTNNTNTTETGGAGEAFRYDSAYRMRDNFEGVTSGSLDGLSSNTPRHTGSLTYDTVRGYALDGVGNRSEVTANGIVESAYLLAGDDFKTNQYSFVDDAPQRYDLAGNLLTDGTWSFQYDFRNQLIRATDGTTDARYRHDVLGRRVSKRTASGNFPGLAYGHAVYIQSGTEILQERDTSSNIRKEWVYGIRIDEPIRQRAPDYADLDNDTNTTELVDLYYLTNSLGSVTALVTTSGTVAERYVMDVWGLIRNVIDKSGTPTDAAWTLVGNPWTFTWRQFEFEERTGLYHYRARGYRAGVGQFLQRDPLGVWGDSRGMGLSRSFLAHNPVRYLDPYGLLVDESGEPPMVRRDLGFDRLRRGVTVTYPYARRSFKLSSRSGAGLTIPGRLECVTCVRVEGGFCPRFKMHRATVFIAKSDDEAEWERHGRGQISVSSGDGNEPIQWAPGTEANVERHEGVHTEHFRQVWLRKRDSVVAAETPAVRTLEQCLRDGRNFADRVNVAIMLEFLSRGEAFHRARPPSESPAPAPEGEQESPAPEAEGEQ